MWEKRRGVRRSWRWRGTAGIRRKRRWVGEEEENERRDRGVEEQEPGEPEPSARSVGEGREAYGREEELEVLQKRFEQSQKEWTELHAQVGFEEGGQGQCQENEKVATTVVSLLRESVPAGMGVNWRTRTTRRSWRKSWRRAEPR